MPGHKSEGPSSQRACVCMQMQACKNSAVSDLAGRGHVTHPLATVRHSREANTHMRMVQQAIGKHMIVEHSDT